MAQRTAEATWDEVRVECTHCGLPMAGYLGSGKRVHYFRCTSCRRWVTSSYGEILSADAKVRARPAGEQARSGEQPFQTVKDRLERWLAALDERDPYRVLGVSPMAPLAAIKARYRELALERHPDRGGSVDDMRLLNLAYERILDHRQRQAAEELRRRMAALPGSAA